MIPLCVLVVLLCFWRGGVCNAVHVSQMTHLQVEYGQPAILPCNGSANLGEEESVQWEASGEEVATLRGQELEQGDKYQNRVRLWSGDRPVGRDWSLELERTRLSDSDMYECIWEGRKTISTVWLSVQDPHTDHFVVVPEGVHVELHCYVHVSRSQSPYDLQVWWTRNDSTVISASEDVSSHVVSNPEDRSRMALFGETEEEFHLYISSSVMSDNGEYKCLYKTKESDDPKPGIPESVTLTVLEANPTVIVFEPHESTTATEDRLSTVWSTTTVTEEVTQEVTDLQTTESPPDIFPVLLEDFTRPMQATTESQPMEAYEETMTSFPPEGTPDTEESFQWDTLPWVLIGLLAGVLVITAVVMCILGVLHKV